jgi:hypothetical protein
MRRMIGFCLLLMLSLPATAADESQVTYQGGTDSKVKEGAAGTLDLSSPTTLEFKSASDSIPIPYASIRAYQYSRELARHLGVIPAVATGLVRKRQRRHLFRITYQDENQVTQVAVFEVPKQMPRTLLAVLEARAPKATREKGGME